METEKPFKPTPAMFRCKACLHRSCPPETAVTLTPSDSRIVSHIRPFSLLQLQRWLELYGEDFWEFLITPPQSDGLEIQSRVRAYEAVLQVLELEEISPEVLRLKLDAAKMLLSNRQPLVAIQNNNGQEAMPRGLRGKSASQIEERLNQLTKYAPRPELSGVVEAEME